MGFCSLVVIIVRVNYMVGVFSMGMMGLLLLYQRRDTHRLIGS